jgi:hypothetical protein
LTGTFQVLILMAVECHFTFDLAALADRMTLRHAPRCPQRSESPSCRRLWRFGELAAARNMLIIGVGCGD